MSNEEEQHHQDQGVLFELDVVAEKKAPKRAAKKSVAKCSVCGKGLSDPKSVEAGYGPVCMHNHYAVGQKEYVGNLFLLDQLTGERELASFDIEKVGDNAFLITDLDDDEDKPSVTNSIDEILRRLDIDKHKNKIACLGSDGMYSQYNGTWKFLGWTKEEALKGLRLRKDEE